MKRNNKWITAIGKTLFQGFCWFYGLISLYPIIWLVFYSFKDNSEIFVTNTFGIPRVLRFENYTKAWSQYNVPMYFMNSLIIAIATVTITIVLALLFSYATSRMKWKGKDMARLYLSMGMFIPVQAIMIPVARTINGLGLNTNRWGLILTYTAINMAFASLVYYGFFRSIPVELEEAACIDGASVYISFIKIIVPLVKPATATLVIYIFLNSWNEFNLANVLVIEERLKTLPLGILFLQGSFTTDWGAMGATMVIASMPTVLLYSIFSQKVEDAMTIGGALKE